MINVGENLKKERSKKNYSLEYLALKLGVSPTTIYRMEVGNKHLCMDLFFRYCDLLEVTPRDVLSDYASIQKEKIALEIGRKMLEIFSQSLPFVLSQFIGIDVLMKSVNQVNDINNKNTV